MTDSTSFYRAMGPLAELRKRMPELSVIVLDKFNWATLAPVDVVFMQRPYAENHLQIIQMAKQFNKPVWIDYDDDLFRVPPSNPTHRQYGQEDTLKNMAQIIQLADVVTVTTNYLKNSLAPLNSNIRVIPNAFDMDRYSYRARSEKRNPLVFWRGSATHDKDLWSYTGHMVAAAQNSPKFTWTFMGSPFWLTMEQMPKNSMVVEALEVDEYMKTLHDVQPALMQVPLHDNPFNRAKSNIAWIEGTFAGAVTLGPDWEEWQKPGVLNYGKPGQYYDHLHDVTHGNVDLKKHADLSWEYIWDKLSLRKVNDQRISLIRELAECRR